MKRILLSLLVIIILLFFSFPSFAAETPPSSHNAADIANYFGAVSSDAWADKFLSMLENVDGALTVLKSLPLMPIIFKLSLTFAGILFFIGIAIEMYKLLIFGQGSYANIFFRFMFVIFFLSCYFTMLDAAFNFGNQLFEKTLHDPVHQQVVLADQALKSLMNDKEEQEKTAYDTICAFGEKVKQYVSNPGSIGEDIYNSAIVAMFRSMTFVVINATGILEIIVVCVCIVVRNFYLAFVVLSGPIAFVLLILPGTQKFFFGWLFNFIMLWVWPLVAGVIVVAQAAFLSSVFHMDSTQLSQGGAWWVIGYDVALLVGTVMSFSIAPSIFKGTAGVAQSANAVLGAGLMAARFAVTPHSAVGNAAANTAMQAASTTTNSTMGSSGGGESPSTPYPTSPEVDLRTSSFSRS